ncbi:MAG: ferritin family protein [Chloroflexi bacterium]|nr:ferritin family protein [Chloroflexota bacterium]
MRKDLPCGKQGNTFGKEDMVTEQDRTLAALQTAIQMEIDGKACYLSIAEASKNPLEKKLLESFAAEEDLHRQQFEKIYNAVRAKKAWPKSGFQPDKGQRLKEQLAATCEALGMHQGRLESELDAIELAINKENQSFDFYRRQAREAAFPAERDFYETLATEESGHRLVLLDYYEYLKDPAAWFVEKEHPSLDAG